MIQAILTVMQTTMFFSLLLSKNIDLFHYMGRDTQDEIVEDFMNVNLPQQ